MSLHNARPESQWDIDVATNDKDDVARVRFWAEHNGDRAAVSLDLDFVTRHPVAASHNASFTLRSLLHILDDPEAEGLAARRSGVLAGVKTCIQLIEPPGFAYTLPGHRGAPPNQ